MLDGGAHEKACSEAADYLARAYEYGVTEGLLVQSWLLDREDAYGLVTISTLMLKAFSMTPMTAEDLNARYGAEFFFEPDHPAPYANAWASWNPARDGRRMGESLDAERKRLGLCLKCGSRGEMRGMACVCPEHGAIWGA